MLFRTNVLALFFGFAAATVASSLVLAQKAEDVSHVAPDADPTPGDVHQWKSPQGQPYWYRIPTKVSKSSPPNLLLMLHGTGLSEGWSFWNYPIASGRFRADDIVVSPDGLTPGSNDTFNFVQGKKDGDQIASIIDTFRRSYPIGRVYLYGHSQGAFFCYWFAGAHPELVDGIVAHAGNVLEVQHTKASRTGVAIGILHGAADAVVPVECAHRTAKVYREEGYDNVKLYVVEGLTKHSGHWPLPVQVLEMLDWLDEVTEASPDKVLSRGWGIAATAEAPDLAALRGALDRAHELTKAKKRTAKPEPEFAERAALLDEFLSGVAAAHIAALADAGEALRAKSPDYGPFAAHFRAVHRVMRGHSEWERALSVAVRNAKSHEKACTKALAALAEKPGKKAVQRAVKALAKSILAPNYERLDRELAKWIESPEAKALGDGWLVDLREPLRGRVASDETGTATARQVTAAFARKFRDEHPELVVVDEN